MKNGPTHKTNRLPAPPPLTGQVGKTRWVNLSTVTYIDRNLAERKWDVVSRTTKKAEAYADAVVILSVVTGGKYGSKSPAHPHTPSPVALPLCTL